VVIVLANDPSLALVHGSALRRDEPSRGTLQSRLSLGRW
jgi:hypothetical protein